MPHLPHFKRKRGVGTVCATFAPLIQTFNGTWRLKPACCISNPEPQPWTVARLIRCACCSLDIYASHCCGSCNWGRSRKMVGGWKTFFIYGSGCGFLKTKDNAESFEYHELWFPNGLHFTHETQNYVSSSWSGAFKMEWYVSDIPFLILLAHIFK